MKNLNLYITEKLKLTKDFNPVTLDKKNENILNAVLNDIENFLLKYGSNYYVKDNDDFEFKLDKYNNIEIHLPNLNNEMIIKLGDALFKKLSKKDWWYWADVTDYGLKIKPNYIIK